MADLFDKRRFAVLERQERRPRLACTGVAAVWCPIHGDCWCFFDGKGDCPLHAPSSTHADPEQPIIDVDAALAAFKAQRER